MKSKSRIKKPFYKQFFPMLIFIGLIIYTISFLTPLFWSIITSFKSVFDYNMNPFGFPQEYQIYNDQENILGNYLVAWDNIKVEKTNIETGLNEEIHMWQLLGNYNNHFLPRNIGIPWRKIQSIPSYEMVISYRNFLYAFTYRR